MYNKGRKRRGVNNRATNKNSSSNNMATKGNLPKKERVLMRAWLVKRVEEGQIPGLVWDDAAHTMIRIPWVHGSRHAWAIEKHSKLFQAWAEHSGRYDGHGINPKRWKANFRCALNSLSDVHEVRKLRRKGQSAYKVYKLDLPKSAISRNTPDRHPKRSDSPRTKVEDVTSNTDNADKALIQGVLFGENNRQEDNQIKTEDPDQREIITSDDRSNQSENLLRNIDGVISSMDTFDTNMTQIIQRSQSPGVILNQLGQITSEYSNDREIDKTQAADVLPMIASDQREDQNEKLILKRIIEQVATPCPLKITTMDEFSEEQIQDFITQYSGSMVYLDIDKGDGLLDIDSIVFHGLPFTLDSIVAPWFILTLDSIVAPWFILTLDSIVVPWFILTLDSIVAPWFILTSDSIVAPWFILTSDSIVAPWFILTSDSIVAPWFILTLDSIVAPWFILTLDSIVAPWFILTLDSIVAPWFILTLDSIVSPWFTLTLDSIVAPWFILTLDSIVAPWFILTSDSIVAPWFILTLDSTVAPWFILTSDSIVAPWFILTLDSIVAPWFILTLDSIVAPWFILTSDSIVAHGLS
ncbi:hypothetical protein LSH36_977g02054 [Paralvinella palmiformis]|uniref:IRF tryptophan pentad repeat domain-containing protein n=1 Tax=Paralvinella palmiformis TaxID=53620 RepID=A0AAD9MTD2_9ANNE|nr:hypothetical protein LSH36_977g02054 [Paralvinella palmiformis]